MIKDIKDLERGSMLLDALLAVAVAAMIFQMLVLPAWREQSRKTAAIQAGGTTSKVKAALDRYIQSRYQSIDDAISDAEGPIHISMFSLCDSGELAQEYCSGEGEDIEVYNALEQRHNVLAYKNAHENIVAITIASGGDMRETLAASVSAELDADGGIVTNTACLSVEPPCLLGNGGAWEASVVDFTSDATLPYLPQEGDVVALSVFGKGELIKPYLYRVDIGNPEANRMATDIDMGNNSILNVKDIWVEPRQMWLTEVMDSTYTVPDGTIIDKPVCPTNSPNPQIFVTPQVFFDHGPGYPIAGVAAYANDVPGNTNQWQVNLEVRTQVGYMRPSAETGRLKVEIRCTPY